MWLTKSHIVLVIFLLIIVLFIHFILDIKKGVLYPVKQINHFLVQ